MTRTSCRYQDVSYFIGDVLTQRVRSHGEEG
jgi:hypothetical protein